MDNKTLRGRLKLWLRWPMAVCVVMAALTMGLLVLDFESGMISAAVFLVVAAITLVLYATSKKLLMKELMDFGAQYASQLHAIMKDLKVPYGLMDQSGQILWANHCLEEILGKDLPLTQLSAYVPELKAEDFAGKEETEIKAKLDKATYSLQIHHMNDEAFPLKRELEEFAQKGSDLYAFYMMDQTEVMDLRKEVQNSKLVYGIILVDNYEEALDSIEDVNQAMLSSLVNRKIISCMQGYDAIVNKVERDRYVFIIKQKYLPMIQSSKFAVLDEVRATNIGNDTSMTLSIGVGINAATSAQGLEWARQALGLALGRGGDQAVVKDHEKISYYGGKTKQVEKSTRVRARIKAHALRQIVNTGEQVVIMGHKYGDVDCFGAAIGVYRAARILNKRAFIVVSDSSPALRPMMTKFQDNPDYNSDMFVTPEQARNMVDAKTILVVVDVGSADRTEAPELVNLTKSIVVIDHHRQNDGLIENPVLSYIEPNASSASEMVAEILQYITDSVKLPAIEADAMYAGMIIDTDGFQNKTGSRTFEAAAFLRKCGADVTRVRLQLRDDMATCKARAEAVTHARIEGKCAFSICPAEGLDAPQVVGAQAANELLNVSGVEASFVATEVNEMVFISARSFEMNVQLVMERLGGGGHATIAGAQLKNMTAAEALEQVRRALASMEQEGEI